MITRSVGISMNKLMLIILAIVANMFAVSGCNPEMRELERVSCGLPEGCYEL